jgi:hypothetical protein
MIFGKVLTKPAGAYLVTVPDHPRDPSADYYLRLWG